MFIIFMCLVLFHYALMITIVIQQNILMEKLEDKDEKKEESVGL